MRSLRLLMKEAAFELKPSFYLIPGTFLAVHILHQISADGEQAKFLSAGRVVYTCMVIGIGKVC